ncbi:MAG: hypothetical protein JHC61_00860 [Burkholderiaceae bacterium]|nr:hypothetical protein [Burkholderiaceae bacterium]
MLFYNTAHNPSLRRALRAAVASHRPAALQALLASHGEVAFAQGIAGFSDRVIADALTMLADQNCSCVLSHLPRAARKRLRVVADAAPRRRLR